MNEAWYHSRNGQQIGPATLDQLYQRVSSGELQASDLVWREGMPNWIEAQKTPELTAAFGGAPMGAVNPTYQHPAGAIPAAPYAAPYTAPYAAGGYPAGVLPYHTPQQSVRFAGFWIRFVAAIVDGIITAIPGFIIGFALQAGGTPGQPNLEASLLSNVVGIVIGWLYEALFTASKYQGTPGKILLGIRVTDVQGNQISFARATGRHFAKIISAIILLIGYIMAAFDDRKRALHDIMAGTLVTYK